MDYIAKAEREVDPEKKLRLLEAAQVTDPVAATPAVSSEASTWPIDPGLTRSSHMRPTYLYGVTRKCNLLHVVG